MAELVLNVDDFEPQRYHRTAALRAAGFDVIDAATGQRALELVRERKPALVLLDVDLPDLNGIDVCRRIKSDPETARTLVLHISAVFRDAAARVQALENGADGYLVEPVEADELLAQVRSLLRLARAEAKAWRAEEALRESTRLLRAISDTSTDAIYAKDLSGRIRFANPATVEPLGKTLQDVLGRTEAEYLDDPEAARRVKEVDREVMASGVPRVVEEVVPGADGTPHVWLSSKVPYRSPDGLVIGLLGISRDITARKRTEEALGASQERLTAFFNASGVLMTIVELTDDDVVCVMPNGTLAGYFGMGAQELAGKGGRELGFTEEQLARSLRALRECYDSGRPRAVEFEATMNGRHGWYEATTSPIPARPGVRPQLALVIVEITERKHAEEALRRSEQRYRALVETAPHGVFINRNDRVVYANPAMVALLGASCEADLLGRSILDLFHPDSHAIVRARIASLRSGEPVPLIEERMLRLDGGVREVEVAAAPCDYQDAAAIQVVVRDVTEQRQVRDQLRASEQRLTLTAAAAARSEAEIASIYDSAPIGLCIFDSEGRFVRINRRLAEINGRSPEAHVGRTIAEVVPDIADQAEPVLRRVVETGQPVLGVEIQGRAPGDPETIRTWIENWHPIRNAAGAVVGVNVAVQEITDLKRVEQELRDANRIKDEFLATLSHELRTPLNAILGWSHLLQRGVLDEATTRQAVVAIARNAEAQRKLVTDVLEMSRMISGKLRLRVRDADLCEITIQAVESARPAFDAKGVRLTPFGLDKPATVTGDPDRLQQIVWNLLSNAAKFTPPGGIVSVGIERRANTFDLVVSDNGIGIRPDFLPHVFDRFSQADTSTSRAHGGLGLGLSIVRQLVELQGGRVAAVSEGEGKGATFTVSLPARAALGTEQDLVEGTRGRRE